MIREVYRYEFSKSVDLDDVRATLTLSLLAVESLHGETQTQLDAGHYLDTETRQCAIDADTPLGRDLNRLFTGYLRREYPQDAFQVHRIKRGALNDNDEAPVAKR